MGFLGTPLGWIMKFLYEMINNYGVALMVFTLLVRVILFPINVKTQKSQARMGLMQPKQKALEKKYGKNKERYQEELMKLYQEEGYNPASSCLPMVIQMIVLFGIIDVVYHPLEHLLSVSDDIIDRATAALSAAGASSASGAELQIINILQGNDTTYSASIFDGIFSAEQLAAINEMNLNFLGINLGFNPDFSFPLILIPILSGITSLGVTVFSMRQQKRNGTSMDGQQGAGMMKTMMYTMPLFSVWIGFSLPAGAGVYWITGNVLSFLQSIILYTFYSPEKMKDKVAKENEKRKKKGPSKFQQAMADAKEEQLRQQGKLPSKKKEETQDDPANDISAAERIAQARKRMAEKYGDE